MGMAARTRVRLLGPGVPVMADLPCPEQGRGHDEGRDEDGPEQSGTDPGEHGDQDERKRREADRETRGDAGEGPTAVHDGLEQGLEQQQVGRELAPAHELEDRQGAGHDERDDRPTPTSMPPVSVSA